MPIYTGHAPVLTKADLAASDRFAFVRDGFHFWAALAAPIWLVWHRLWLALIGWIGVVVGLDAAMAALGAGPTAIFLGNVPIAPLTRFEAGGPRRRTLSRRHWRQFDI